MVHLTEAIGQFAELLLRAIGLAAMKIGATALGILLIGLGGCALALVAANLIRSMRRL